MADETLVVGPPKLGPNNRGAQSTIRAHVGTVEAERLAEEIAAEHPGRVSTTAVDPNRKPAKGSTPWRSTVAVSSRHSADGFGYMIGDSVTEAEALRQGLIVQEPVENAETRMLKRPERLPCPRCEARGTFAKRKPRGHKADCPCRFCGPCPECNGARYLTVEKEESTDGG